MRVFQQILNKLNMKEIIKNNIGLVGMIIAAIMIFVGYYYYDKNESLIVIGCFLWFSSSTIDTQLKKPKPKIWYTYLVAIVFFVLTFLFLIKQINKKNMNEEKIDRIIEMAWEDRTPFEAIEHQFGIKENDVRELMRKEMKESSFKMWRKRVKGRKTKHAINSTGLRFKSKNQRAN